MTATVARRVVYVLLVGLAVTFPLAVWGPERIHRIAMVALYVCSFGPGLVLRWYGRQSAR